MLEVSTPACTLGKTPACALRYGRDNHPTPHKRKSTSGRQLDMTFDEKRCDNSSDRLLACCWRRIEADLRAPRELQHPLRSRRFNNSALGWALFRRLWICSQSLPRLKMNKKRRSGDLLLLSVVTLSGTFAASVTAFLVKHKPDPDCV